MRKVNTQDNSTVLNSKGQRHDCQPSLCLNLGEDEVQTKKWSGATVKSKVVMVTSPSMTSAAYVSSVTASCN